MSLPLGHPPTHAHMYNYSFSIQVFATILAMITDEINNVLLAARSGKAPVALSGHILLLNWNQQVRRGVELRVDVWV